MEFVASGEPEDHVNVLECEGDDYVLPVRASNLVSLPSRLAEGKRPTKEAIAALVDLDDLDDGEDTALVDLRTVAKELQIAIIATKRSLTGLRPLVFLEAFIKGAEAANAMKSVAARPPSVAEDEELLIEELLTVFGEWVEARRARLANVGKRKRG